MTKPTDKQRLDWLARSRNKDFRVYHPSTTSPFWTIYATVGKLGVRIASAPTLRGAIDKAIKSSRLHTPAPQTRQEQK